MKIKRKVNVDTHTFDVEIELNEIEMYKAYFEVQRENDIETIKDYLEYAFDDVGLSEDDKIRDIINDKEYIEKCAKDYRSAINNSARIYYEDTEEWILAEEIVKRNYPMTKGREEK